MNKKELTLEIFGIHGGHEIKTLGDQKRFCEEVAEWHLDKVAQLKAELDEESRLRERLGNLLEQTANTLKENPEPLHLHDWSDLPEVAKQLEERVRELEEELKEISWHGCRPEGY